jgi:integrase
VQRLCGIRYRPPKECRDTSVTMALVAGADPLWVAQQHGHSYTVMIKSYAKWLPKADGGRNLRMVNAALDRVQS